MTDMERDESIQQYSEELIDTLIAISVVSKRLARKLQKEIEERKHEEDKA